MLFAFTQDESEGAYIYEFLGKKYETLFDKVYSNNYTLNTEYFDKIQGGETKNFAPEFTDNELKEFSDEEKTWIKRWEIRARKSSDVLLDVIDAIQKASAGQKISKINVQQNKVYIVKCTFDEYDFNVAIYGQGEQTTLDKIFTKVVVGKIDDLFLEENQKHLYVDVNEGRDYWIMALFEDGKTDPSLIVQISGKYNVLKAEKWLTFLNIINPKLATLDKDPDFDWMENVNLDTESISAEVLEKISNNLNNLNDRTDNSIYGKKRLKSWNSGEVYFGEDKGKPTFTGTEFEKEVKQKIFNELNNEGSFSSINTYDSEHFTWGKGFAVTGKLMTVIENLINIEGKNYEQIFNNVGIKIVNKHFWVLDSEGNWKKDAPPSYEASDYIADNKQLLSFFIELAEKPSYYQDIMDTQYDAFATEGAGNYPGYILNSDKSAYADTWNHASVTVLCHLSHWAGYRWHQGTDRYKDTKGELDKILYKYFYNTLVNYPGMKNGAVLETNIYKWKSTYNILSNLEHWGDPESTGKTKLNEKWNAHTIELEFKNDVDKKLRAVKKQTEKYITNSECVLIKDGNNYIIITKDANSITYEDFKTTK